MRILIAIVIICFLFVSLAFAHTATHWKTGESMGWEYDKECCDGTDCAMVAPNVVTRTPNGYLIVIEKGQHPNLTSKQTFLVPFDAKQVRPSPDGFYHVCVGSDKWPDGSITLAPNLYCLYVPYELG